MAEEEEEEVEKHRLEVIPTGDPDDETCATFVLNEEDHTLGNSLRYMIMKNPEVKFCGYSLPHPSENKINLRIQTHGVPASDVLRRGLSELSTLCEHALATFEASVDQYKQNQANRQHSLSSSDET